MSDNLKVAKECGFHVYANTLGNTNNVDGTEHSLNTYTSRILALQQAAHDAEIAKLKEQAQFWEGKHMEVSMELAASQAREAALREKLEAYTLTPENYDWTIQQLVARAEAAEARIKASREPYLWAWECDGKYNSASKYAPHPNDEKFSFATTGVDGEVRNVWVSIPLFRLPPELAELQRDKETAMRLVTKTIAENESVKRENAELRKLLEESKVPEETLIEIVTQAHMAGQFNQSQRDPSYYEARVYYGEKQLSIRAMLSATPQPKEPKQ